LEPVKHSITNVTIRLATVNDAERIADLSRQTFYETFSPDNTKENMDKFLNEQFTRGRLITEVGKPENIFLLAYSDGDIAGYAKLRDAERPKQLQEYHTLEIARLYVLKKMLGRGVGKVLMQNSLDIAAELKKKIVWLGVWEKNLRAIEFYNRWGFEVFGEWEFLLGDDVQRDFLMKKVLSDDLLK
jgi:GNAT superfamily N-acetyltransferase